LKLRGALNYSSHSSLSTRGLLGCGGRVFLTLFGWPSS
jgi:hypothetical protein